METKKCPSCEKYLDLGHFNKCNATPGGLQRMCRSCEKAYRQEHSERIQARDHHDYWRRGHRERQHDYYLSRQEHFVIAARQRRAAAGDLK